MPRVRHEAGLRYATSHEGSRLCLEACATRPKLVVFDLDYTFWPCYCEMYEADHPPRVFEAALGVLQALHEHDVPVAVASRTPTPDVAWSFMRQLHVVERFCNVQIIPAQDGCDHVTAQKDLEHFPNLKRETGVAYEDMLFFDDEAQNVTRVSRLGVSCVLVDRKTGVHHHALREGLVLHAQKKRSHAQGTSSTAEDRPRTV